MAAAMGAAAYAALALLAGLLVCKRFALTLQVTGYTRAETPRSCR